MSEIIKYRDFEIDKYKDDPHWFYTHKDFDPFNWSDERHGECPTPEECKQEIDDWYKGEEDE